MAPSNLNSYLAYKRDNNLLAQWLVLTYQQITASKSHKHTRHISLSRFQDIVKVIAESKTFGSIPACIFRLLRSVIKARTAFWQHFQRTVTESTNPDVQNSNTRHKHFIDVLQKAFEDLGGNEWQSSQDGKRPETEQDAEEEIRQVLNVNRFSALSINQDDSKSGQSSTSSQASATSNRRDTGRSSRAMNDQSLEDCRIIDGDDESEINLEYQMAAFGLLQEWVEIRGCLDQAWIDVASNTDSNIAVAGAMSNIAIANLKRSESAIFLEFPYHDSYEDFMKALVPGADLGNIKESSIAMLDVLKTCGGEDDHRTETKADANEFLLIYTYQAFMDFVTDFQKNNTGRPTNALGKELLKWDPGFDLINATKEERYRWRRAYTINWLYDLVNLFSTPFKEREEGNGEHWDPSKVDWTFNGY